MLNHPDKFKYVKTHEYVTALENDTVKIGITDFDQDQLGDVTFVELPKPGTSFETERKFGVIESVKSVSDLFMPVAGEIIEVNSSLEKNPELVNNDCYEAGWLIKVKVKNPADLDSLMSAKEYISFIAE